MVISLYFCFEAAVLARESTPCFLSPPSSPPSLLPFLAPFFAPVLWWRVDSKMIDIFDWSINTISSHGYCTPLEECLMHMVVRRLITSRLSETCKIFLGFGMLRGKLWVKSTNRITTVDCYSRHHYQLVTFKIMGCLNIV